MNNPTAVTEDSNTGADARPVSYRFLPQESCPMCGSSSGKILGVRLNRSQGRKPRGVTGVGVTVRQCKVCETIFADPRPIPNEISDHYDCPPESYWVPSYFEVSEEYFAPEIEVAKRLLGAGGNRVALDIGAGIGKGMIALARAGFDAYGIEPSESFRARAIEGMGIASDRLRLASIENAAFPPDSFDFISFGAVLEHIQEPGRALEKALSWLRPGGVIHAEVPSSRHLVAKLINIYFATRGLNYVTNISPMHTPYHLYEFALKSFAIHGERVGYRVVEHEYEVSKIYNIPRMLHPLLEVVMRRMHTGMQMTVWLSREGKN